MAKIKIYRYKVYDIGTGSSSVRPLRATRDAIDGIGAEIIADSCEEVDSLLLDGNGFLRDEVQEHGKINHA